jgi:hypothetical protein
MDVAWAFFYIYIYLFFLNIKKSFDFYQATQQQYQKTSSLSEDVNHNYVSCNIS